MTATATATDGAQDGSDGHRGWEDEDAQPLAHVFSQRLAQALQQAGMSRGELAEAVGVGYNMVTHWMSGRRLPSLQRLVRIGLAVGADLDFLMGMPVRDGILTSAALPDRLLELAHRQAKTDEDYEELGHLHLQMARQSWERATRMRYPR